MRAGDWVAVITLILVGPWLVACLLIGSHLQHERLQHSTVQVVSP